MDRTHSFGYWVRRRRKALDLSQRELARRAACSLSTVKKIEQDTRRPSRQLAEILADCLAVSDNERELFLQIARGQAPVDELTLARQPETVSIKETRSPAIGNLPAELDLLVGREAELTQLSKKLEISENRLVTLIGPGGVGKSRLALAAARQVQDRYSEGAWFISLASVTDPAHLSTAIATTLGLTFAGPFEPDLQLKRQLEGRQHLLVLDNFEQLLPSGVTLVAELLRDLPDLTFIVTSRQRLRLKGEVLIPVAGLSLDAADSLFRQRSQRVGAEIPPDADDTVKSICQLVEGLPLAVELAAAWTRLLSPAEILVELKESLALLASDLHDQLERHRSIEAAFAGSWVQLTPQEQRLLAGLTVFAGDFSRAAVTAVCEAKLPELVRLLDHSLLEREGKRYRLHELVRQLAAKKLALDPVEQKSRRVAHTYYYTDFLARWSALFGSGEPELTGWDSAIADEMPNIRLAWQWAIDQDQPERLQSAILALYHYFDFKGEVHEGLQMCAALVESAERCRATKKASDDILRQTQAAALMGQGILGLRMGQFTFDQAREHLHQAMTLLEGLEATKERIMTITLLGPLALTQKNKKSTPSGFEEVLSLARHEGHIWGQAIVLNFWGLFHITRGKAAKAKDILLEAIALWREHPGLAFCKMRSMVHLGLSLHALGNLQEAQQIQQEAVVLAHEIQDYSFLPLAYCNLAFHHYALGELKLSRLNFRKGLIEAEKFGLMPSFWHSVLGLGLVATAEGQVSKAVTLLSMGLARPVPYLVFLLGEPQRVLARLRDDLDTAVLERAESRGHEMMPDDLLSWLVKDKTV